MVKEIYNVATYSALIPLCRAKNATDKRHLASWRHPAADCLDKYGQLRLLAVVGYQHLQMLDNGSIIVIDEFWKVLQDEGFRDLAKNKLRTIRKQNG